MLNAGQSKKLRLSVFHTGYRIGPYPPSGQQLRSHTRERNPESDQIQISSNVGRKDADQVANKAEKEKKK